MEASLGQTGLPRHIAIIMDGNGRWAKSRGLTRIAGHRAGAESVRETVRACGELGIGVLTLYAFSVENWRRPEAEVNALMLLLRQYLRGEVSELKKNNVRLNAIGRIGGLPKTVRAELARACAATAGNTGLLLNLAINYGGRTELVDAFRQLAAPLRDGRIRPEDIDEETIGQHLYTAGLPDPDLLIRTSGEMRLSNFLLWQGAYTEIYVTDTLWPDFRRPDLVKAIKEFQKRERRFGGVKGQ
jgi:undecaprenyl diphosphate synthase